MFDIGSAALRVGVNAHVAADQRFNNHNDSYFDARNLAINRRFRWFLDKKELLEK
jgi:hypothetical protein